MMPATFWGLIWAKNKCIAASFLPELQGKGNIYSKLLGSLLLSDCIWTSWRHRQGLNWLCILPKSHIWEKFGNGNPLQCSCLENPGDGGAWWAAVYGVAQSWIWLKRLSNSSSSSNSVRYSGWILISSFYREGSWGPEMVLHLIKLVQLVQQEESPGTR